MSRSLVRTIYSLAKYERYKKTYDEEGRLNPVLTSYLNIWCCSFLSEQSIAFALAADRLISNLFSYGGEISIGQRYFQPTFYRPKRLSVYFNWDCRNKHIFCKGCYRERQDCSHSPFSSKCPRFRKAWAVEHIIAATNKLIQVNSRKERNHGKKAGH